MQYLEAHVTYSYDEADGAIFFDRKESTIAVQLTQKEFELIRFVITEGISRDDDVKRICSCVDLFRQMKPIQEEVNKLKPAAEIVASEELKRRTKKENQDGKKD